MRWNGDSLTAENGDGEFQSLVLRCVGIHFVVLRCIGFCRVALCYIASVRRIIIHFVVLRGI